MNSFAFWFRRCPKSGSEKNISISATVNVNLWVDRIHEGQRSIPVYLDFGFMLQQNKRSTDREGQEEILADEEGRVSSNSTTQNGMSLIEQIEGISLYCPFSVQESDCIDLFKSLRNANTLGAIFNDGCNASNGNRNDHYVEVKLDNDNEPFYLLSYEKPEIISQSNGSIVRISFPTLPKNIKNKAGKVYVRFRLTIGNKTGLISSNDSRDKILTSALSREEVIDFRLNDYRTLDDKIRERISGDADDVCRPSSVTIHTLLMANSSVDVDSFETLHEKRLLEGGSSWKDYAPNGEPKEIVAWHWKRKLDKAGEGYKLYLKLKINVCNRGTIALYLLFLALFSVFTNAASDALCNSVGSIPTLLGSAIMAGLLLLYSLFKKSTS